MRRCDNKNSGKQQGISLVEAVVVVGIIAILAGQAVPAFADFFKHRRLEGHAAQLATDIYLVRSQAAAANQGIQLTFGSDAGGTCYVLHRASAGCECRSDGAFQCAGATDAVIKSVGLAARDGVRLETNVSSMVFDPVRGTTSPAGSMDLIADGGKTIRHVVSLMGRLRTCSPQARMTGYKAC